MLKMTMEKFLKQELKKTLEDKRKEKLPKPSEETPAKKTDLRLIAAVVGFGVGVFAGICALQSVQALQKALQEKAEREAAKAIAGEPAAAELPPEAAQEPEPA